MLSVTFSVTFSVTLEVTEILILFSPSLFFHFVKEENSQYYFGYFSGVVASPLPILAYKTIHLPRVFPSRLINPLSFNDLQRRVTVLSDIPHLAAITFAVAVGVD